MGTYKSLALENESIISAGYYVNARGARVDLAADVAAACQGTRSYPERDRRAADGACRAGAGGGGAARVRTLVLGAWDAGCSATIR